eukprot:TRINITY_DN56406_c0_g1_i1.p1 TRINITY_DN56406_c0_g1~~TRINITY_DN56406_c0_g1_i1.p1  ORF type:complete len:1111 (+),score=243.87 TRINITY_DN56406_c0_g1_i1:93-3425(+)
MAPSEQNGFKVYPPLACAGTTFRLYESEKTGLRGLLMETGEPLCNLHVVLATESDTHDWTHKDDGLPHTLEHAIFLGSELYPYKGVLDKLANRSLASGTNAWTAVDHTCYTMESAGHEGCLNLMPIYADHILYPTLTDECFHTEVHHVTSEGENKGVVYCEMQGRENSGSSLVDRKVLDLLYPTGGYSAETGGKMSNLRELTNAQVKRYHKEAYRPDNIMFILSGTAGEVEFVKALGEVEKLISTKAFAKGCDGFKRPWTGTVGTTAAPDTPGIITDKGKSGSPVVVEFPSEDETAGMISMAWRGPLSEDKVTWCHVQCLWAYLTESAIAPLNKALVETDDPKCSGIGPARDVFSEGYHQVWFHDASTKTIDEIVPAFFDAINAAVADFDVERMRVVIKRRRRKILEERERAPTNAVVDQVIHHFLYAPRNVSAEDEVKSLNVAIDDLPHLAEAETFGKEFWQGLINEYILNRPACAVVGKPLATMSTKISDEVDARKKATAEKLGQGGLDEMTKKLEAAIEYNERDIPEKYLTCVPIPAYSSVRSFPLLTMRGVETLAVAPNSGFGVNESTAADVLQRLNESRKQAPAHMAGYWCEWAHIESAFVSVFVAMDTSDLPLNLRFYMETLCDTAFKLPCALDDGKEMTKDQFVAEVQGDTVKYSCGTAGGGLQQMVNFFVQVELDEGRGLALALKWIRRVLHLTKFTAEELKISVKKALSEIPASIRSGPGIVSQLDRCNEFDVSKSNSVNGHAIRQQPFLTKMLERLEASPEEAAKVVDEIKSLKTWLLEPSRMQIFVAGDMTVLSSKAEPYKELAAALLPQRAEASAAPARVGSCLGERTDKSILSGKSSQAVVAALSAIESNFLKVSAPGIGPYDPDHAALLVAIEYLTALEGDFWVKLRGAGLTYGYSIGCSTDTTRISFSLSKCVDLAGAYKAARQIIEGYATGATEITQVELDGAKSTVAYEIISETATRLQSAMLAFRSNYRARGVDYGKWLLSEIDKVTVQDALHAIKKYIVRIFDGSSNLAATCPKNKLDENCKQLEEMLEVPVRKLPEEALYTAFDEALAAGAAEVPPPPAPVVKRSGAGYKFASKFKCECPKCEVPAPPAF